ncbi:MAG: diguanylate cyclase [Eubacterium sp.]|nr:diguanylate cyclase [Eubacterium sp.]
MRIDSLLDSFEESVCSVYQYLETNEDDVNSIFNQKNLNTQENENIQKLILASTRHTTGAVASYIGYNPKLISETAGIYLRKRNGQNDLESVTPMKLSQFDKDDFEHVGWYYVPIESGKATWLQPRYKEDIDCYVISYVIPVFKDGIPICVIGMDLDMQVLQEMIDKISLYETGNGALYLQDGNMVYDGKLGSKWDEKASVSDEESAISRCVTNEKLAGSVTRYTIQETKKSLIYRNLDNGMALVLTVTNREIEAPKTQLLIKSLEWMILICVVLILFSILWGRGLLKPLRELAEAANQVERGDWNVRIPLRGNDEIRTLANSFNQMLLVLRDQMEYINCMAYTDALTNTLNRAGYKKVQDRMDLEIQQGNGNFSVIAMDLNDLKKVNDKYGHEEGNRLIKNSAWIMRKTFGDANVFRVGGDEFMVILPGVSENECRNYVKQFHENLQKYNEKRIHDYRVIRIAVGMAAYEKNVDENFLSVENRADSRMYEDKKGQKGSAPIR